MLRVFAFGLFAAVVTGQSNFVGDVSQSTKVSETQTQNIDPIIVGRSISDAHKQKWKIMNKKYKECGLCGEEMQPFPGDE